MSRRPAREEAVPAVFPSGPRPFKVPESVLVVIHAGRAPDWEVLLIERADHAGFWQSVTGSKDTPDEALRTTAVREVAEETGIRIGSTAVRAAALRDWRLANVYDIYPAWRHRYAEGVTRNTEYVFGLRVPRDIAVRLAPHEHVASAWWPWREAADRCYSPSNAEAILQLPRYAR